MNRFFKLYAFTNVYNMKYYIIFIALAFWGCSNNIQKTDNDLDIINVPVKTSDHLIKMSEFVDSISYTPLETNDDCLIGNIDKLLVTDKYYYIIDTEIACAVLCFDKKGTFIRKIGNRGVGNGEYVSISDVNVYNDDIYIMDSDLMKLFIFNEEGILEKEIKIHFLSEKFFIINDSWICLFGDYKHNNEFLKNEKFPNVLFMNIENGKVMPDIYFDSMLNVSGIMSMPANFTINGALCIPLNDTIYQTTHSEYLKRKYVLKYPEKYMVAQNNYLDRLKTEKIEAYQAEEQYQVFPYLIRMVDTSEYSLFFYTFKSFYYWGIYDQQTRVYTEAAGFKRNPVENDIDNVANFLPKTSYGDLLYGWIQPGAIEDKAAFQKKWNIILGEENNPIIVSMKMKKN